MFCIYLRTNSDLCHLHHKLIGFYNPDEKCLQRGTDWGFKYRGLRFVFKGLNHVPIKLHVTRSSKDCWHRNARMPSLFIVIGVGIDVNNIKLFSVAMEIQQWISFAILSSYTVSLAAVYNNENYI